MAPIEINTNFFYTGEPIAFLLKNDEGHLESYQAKMFGAVSYTIADASDPLTAETAKLASIDPIERVLNSRFISFQDAVSSFIRLALGRAGLENDYTKESLKGSAAELTQFVINDVNPTLLKHFNAEISNLHILVLNVDSEDGHSVSGFSQTEILMSDLVLAKVYKRGLQFQLWRENEKKLGHDTDVSLYTPPAEVPIDEQLKKMQEANALVEAMNKAKAEGRDPNEAALEFATKLREEERSAEAAATPAPTPTATSIPATAPAAAPAPAVPTTAVPATPQGPWTCSCGAENTSKFCTNCGSPSPFWTCSCGNVNKGGKFCQECGKPRA